MTTISKKTTQLTSLGVLTALLVVLSFTPLGFIQIPPVAITLLHIPVIIGSLLLGPVEGAVLGLVFGITSMIKANFSASPVDLLFSPFASGAPLCSLIMCLVPRILLGIIPGSLYRLIHKWYHNQALCSMISAGVATLCHTFLVLGCLSLFFSTLTLKDIFLTIVSINGGLELLLAVLISPAVCLPVKKVLHLQKLS